MTAPTDSGPGAGAGAGAPAGASEPVLLTHNRVTLALHPLRTDGDGHPVLLLHGLGERTPAAAPAWLDGWPGPVWGLDLTGHGASTPSTGGGYTAEILMADVAVALDHTGPATIVGRGLGAYVGMLAAGACPDRVRGVVLLDGPGLAGGGPAPGSPMMLSGVTLPPGPPDPYALVELTRDVRPPDYALSWVHQAVDGAVVDPPITVATRFRPPWLTAVAGAPGVVEADLPDALAAYA